MKGPLTYFPKQISSFPWRQPWQSHQRRKGTESQLPEARFASCPPPACIKHLPSGPAWGGACRDPHLPRPALSSGLAHSRSRLEPAPGPWLCPVLSADGPAAPPVPGLVFCCTSPPQLGAPCSQPCRSVAPALLATPVTSLLGPDHACSTHRCPWQGKRRVETGTLPTARAGPDVVGRSPGDRLGGHSSRGHHRPPSSWCAGDTGLSR